MKSHPIGIPSIAFCLTIFCQGVPAQHMRADCSTDPASPGGCFFDVPGEGQLTCTEGIISFFPTEQTHSFHRINPDGTEYAHVNTKDQSIGFCYWADFFAGTCIVNGQAGPGAFLGEVNGLNANGVIRPEGYLGRFSCPWYGRSKGWAYRAFDQEQIEIDVILAIIKDQNSPTGCAVRTCQIVAPE